MRTGNTFTYRQSELPLLSAENKAEIAALDVQIADLILKLKGHYRGLGELAKTLNNCLGSCELSLNSIGIIRDDSPQPSISMRDLPRSEKKIIFATALGSTIAIKTLASVTSANL